MEINLGKFETSDWIHLIFLSIATIVVGCLFIFSFKRDLFIELDYIKLILLASAITLPAWLLNSSIAVIINMWTKANPDPKLMSLAGSGITIPIFLLAILLNYYYPVPCKWAVSGIIAIEIIILLIVICIQYYNEKKEKNKTKQSSRLK